MTKSHEHNKDRKMKRLPFFKVKGNHIPFEKGHYIPFDLQIYHFSYLSQRNIINDCPKNQRKKGHWCVESNVDACDG